MNDAKPPDLHILEQQASVCVQGVFPGASHSIEYIVGSYTVLLGSTNTWLNFKIVVRLYPKPIFAVVAIR